MRRKSERIPSFAGRDDHLPKVVREFRQKYKGISELLDAHPEILDLVHRDLSKLSEGERKGCQADFTSETLLRALVVMMVEGLSYQETVIRIAESDFFQDFIRTPKRAVMDHTFLNRAFNAIRPATWKRVNDLLAKGAGRKTFLIAMRHYMDVTDEAFRQAAQNPAQQAEAQNRTDSPQPLDDCGFMRPDA